LFVLTLPDNINGRNAMPGLRYMFAVASGAILLAGNAFAADPFTLSSSSFKDGTLLPKKMAGDIKTNPNCVGEMSGPISIRKRYRQV